VNCDSFNYAARYLKYTPLQLNCSYLLISKSNSHLNGLMLDSYLLETVALILLPMVLLYYFVCYSGHGSACILQYSVYF